MSMNNQSGTYRGPEENQRWNKLDSSIVESKDQVTLFVNYSYNSF